MQANSPIRTLDELDVCEVVSTPYFPTSMERKQRQGKVEGENEVPHSETFEVGFGVRRRHRCFVVTARARSFLYHQVQNHAQLYACLGVILKLLKSLLSIQNHSKTLLKPFEITLCPVWYHFVFCFLVFED